MCWKHCHRQVVAAWQWLPRTTVVVCKLRLSGLQVVQLLEDYSMVNFSTLDITDEESIEELLQSIDLAIQVIHRVLT